MRKRSSTPSHLFGLECCRLGLRHGPRISLEFAAKEFVNTHSSTTMLFCPYCSNNLTIGDGDDGPDKCW